MVEDRTVPTLRYVVADVFTDVPLVGNQLAVFTDGRDVDDETMQKLAREMNFSETVFVLPPEAGGHARIRIITPAVELPFAGHPVLGSAFVLGMPLQLGEIHLETGAGIIPVALEREGASIVFGRMQQPIPNLALSNTLRASIWAWLKTMSGEVAKDGGCRRQELARVLGRVSGAHCVDCPHWVALETEAHEKYLIREWKSDPAEFVRHHAAFLPEDFRALRRWLHARARAEAN